MARRKSIGWVGLGAMGSPIVRRLMGAGWRLVVFDRRADKMSPFAEAGAAAADSPREVAVLSDIVFSMVTDDDAVRQIAFGDDGVIGGLATGKVYADMSTVSPALVLEIDRAASQTGARTLDVRVSGSVPAAEQGGLLVLAGGDQRVFDKVMPVLDVLGRKVIHTGDHGSAAVTKLALNILLGLEVEALAEAFLLARKGGISPSIIADAIQSSAMASPVVTAKLDAITRGSFDPQFKLKLMQKDFRLALDEATLLETPLPATAAANELAISGLANGLGEQDFSALYTALMLLAGIKPEGDRVSPIKEPVQAI